MIFSFAPKDNKKKRGVSSELPWNHRGYNKQGENIFEPSSDMFSSITRRQKYIAYPW